ncbi:MAG: ABC transporter ATP-binding protein [Kiloniellales bacterium]
MLRLSDVHTHYGLSHILQGIDLLADEGEAVALFGRNGVGKTTIIKTIAGWLKPSAGRIEFNGQAIDGWAPEKIARAGIGLVPEDRRIFPGLTVEENLNLGFLQKPKRPSGAERRRALERIYQRFPRLAERRKQNGTTLSGGEQQMLSMARVLLGDPRLLLIDEPTEGLAPLIVSEILRILNDLKKDRISILLVEQNVDAALSLVDRFYTLERGRVLFEGQASNPDHWKRAFEAFEV